MHFYVLFGYGCCWNQLSPSALCGQPCVPQSACWSYNCPRALPKVIAKKKEYNLMLKARVKGETLESPTLVSPYANYRWQSAEVGYTGHLWREVAQPPIPHVHTGKGGLKSSAVLFLGKDNYTNSLHMWAISCFNSIFIRQNKITTWSLISFIVKKQIT